MEATIFVYILLLQQNKYYVGHTSNPRFMTEEHFQLNNTQWTQKYTPIRLLEFISNCDKFDEDKYTLKYMDKYGIDNVRGGSFCKEILDEPEKFVIEKMLMNANKKSNFINTNIVQNDIIPIELQNNYMFTKKNIDGCYEYEWRPKEKIFGDCSINIYTFHNIEKVYFSVYDYFILVENIINKKITLNENYEKTMNNFNKKYIEFAKINFNNPNIIYEFDFSESLKKFLEDKFRLKNISKTHGYYERNFNPNTLISYVNSHTTSTTKAFVIRITFTQESFILKFIANI